MLYIRMSKNYSRCVPFILALHLLEITNKLHNYWDTSYVVKRALTYVCGTRDVSFCTCINDVIIMSSEKLRQILSEHEQSKVFQMSSYAASRPLSPSHQGSSSSTTLQADHRLPRPHLSSGKSSPIQTNFGMCFKKSHDVALL
jgi:hypothetical protein